MRTVEIGSFVNRFCRRTERLQRRENGRALPGRPRAVGLLELLLQKAHTLAPADPRRAARFARTATLLAGRVSQRCAAVPSPFVTARAEALREAADNLARIPRFRPAERAAWHARRLLAQPGLGDVSRLSARTDMTLGWILFCGSRLDEALALLRHAADVLLTQCHDTSGWAKARITEAAMLARNKRHQEALLALDQTLATPGIEQILDQRTLAVTSSNAAVSAVEVGDPRAEELCIDALRRLEAAGMHIERLRAQSTYAKLLRKQGRTDEAIAEYTRVSDELTRRGFAAWGASIAACVAEIHEEQGRYREAENLARKSFRSSMKRITRWKSRRSVSSSRAAPRLPDSVAVRVPRRESRWRTPVGNASSRRGLRLL